MTNKIFVLSGIILLVFVSSINCGKKSSVTPSSINNSPTVTLTGNPSSGNAPLAVQFNASAQDSDGSIVKYEWDFDGNNAYDSITTVNTLNYTYTNNDTCNAQIRVTDNDGATAEAAVSICVTATTATISFTPSATPVNNSVYLSQVSTNNDEITLSLNAKGVANVHGTAIEIDFDSSKISYISSSEGDFLSQGGNTNTIFTPGLEQGNYGVLLIAVDRTNTNVGVNGDGVLATIVFKALTPQGNTPISFNTTNSALKLPAGGGNISGVNWLGGSLSYQ